MTKDEICLYSLVTFTTLFIITLILFIIGLLATNIYLAYYLETIFYENNDFTNEFLGTLLGQIMIYFLIFMIINALLDFFVSFIVLFVAGTLYICFYFLINASGACHVKNIYSL
jgi:hypothetical protein